MSRGHVAVCVYAAIIEALITSALAAADVRDPDLLDQHLTALDVDTTDWDRADISWPAPRSKPSM